MTAKSEGDAAPKLTQQALDDLRLAMQSAEPNWPVMAGELARHIELMLPLVLGTVQATAAEHALHEYTRELDAWHRLADRYYAEFERSLSS